MMTDGMGEGTVLFHVIAYVFGVSPTPQASKTREYLAYCRSDTEEKGFLL